MRTKKKTKKIDLFLDSGAFSAWSQKTEIDIKEYIAFVKEHEEHLEVYANLDSIGDAKQTLKNQRIMEKAGLTPLPCFHYGEDFKYLEKYVAEYDYLALGGMVPISNKDLTLWLDELFNKYLTDDKGMPVIKIHGFGLTSLKMMLRYPWFSVDSTSWVITGRLGSIYVPRFRSGKFVYDVDSWKVGVSSRSPDKKAGQHIEAFSPKQQEIITEYFEDKGYKLGSSKYKTKNEDYELKDNEKWISKPCNGKREVEIIIEDGLCNNYMLRDELNVIYFMDLEKHLPEYPWAWEKHAGVGGFGL